MARWSNNEIAALKQLAKQGVDWQEIAEQLGRGEEGTRIKATQLGLIKRTSKKSRRVYSACVLS